MALLGGNREHKNLIFPIKRVITTQSQSRPQELFKLPYFCRLPARICSLDFRHFFLWESERGNSRSKGFHSCGSLRFFTSANISSSRRLFSHLTLRTSTS